MKKIICLLTGTLFAVALFSQTYQPLEDQRLSTSNNVQFQDIVVDRGGGTGAIYLGAKANDRYLYYDGLGNYRFGGNPPGVNYIALHSNNFNSYAPTLTGVGASGAWNITSAYAINWGGKEADFTAFGSSPEYLVGYDPLVSKMKPFNAGSLRQFLGIPVSGETLQSVTDRGNITANTISTSSEFRGIADGIDMRIGARSFTNGLAGWGTVSNHPLALFVNGSERMRIQENGSVAIGTGTASNAQGWGRVLDVHGDAHAKMLVTSTQVQTGIFSHNDWGDMAVGKVGTESYHPLVLMAGYGNDVMTLQTNGNVGIGVLTPTEKLSVNGTVLTKKVKVTQNWADYVFDSGYQLPSLIEVKQYIQHNKHLPGMPSASAIAQNGLDLGEICKLQQEKIEQLTLYLIQQDAKQDSLMKQMKKQESLIKRLCEKVGIANGK